MTDTVEAFLAARVSAGAAHKIMTALDEIVSNILKHGGGVQSPSIAIQVDVTAHEVTVEIADDGHPFNPLDADAPDTKLDLEAREIGGLGIHLVRSLMDEVSYRRRGEGNWLRIRKTLLAGDSKA